jgi:DNA-3-methyladenine glycosylase II
MSAACAGAPAVLRLAGPFDLALSLRAAASFVPLPQAPPPVLRAGLRIDGRPTLVAIRQRRGRPQEVAATAAPPLAAARLQALAARLVNAGLDLRPFYALAAADPVLAPVVQALWGVKPLPPPSLFEMLIVAITEQQLSLAAAFHIRRRLVERFGAACGQVSIFPEPAALAAADPAQLQACGLSRRKAEYVRDVAAAVAAGRLDLDALAGMSEAAAQAVLEGQRGFGRWSAQYVLTRGLGRADCLPAEDVGLRRVVGRYFCGRPLSPQELERVLAPFAPYRSLAAYYLAVHARLFRPGPAGAAGA